MPLYTFILEYQGGTFISQVTAPEPRAARAAWVVRFSQENPAGMSPAAIAELREEVLDQEGQPLDELRNVWCISASLTDGYALINFVETAASSSI